jgi:hypothetical protein
MRQERLPRLFSISQVIDRVIPHARLQLSKRSRRSDKLIDLLVIKYMTCSPTQREDKHGQQDKTYFKAETDATTVVKGRHSGTKGAFESQNASCHDL